MRRLPTSPIKHSCQIGNIKLFHGNAMDILPLLDEKAAMIASDIPYRLTSGGSNSGELGGIFSNEKYNNNGSIVVADVPFEEMMQALYEALLESGDCYVFINDKNFSDLEMASRKAGFQMHLALDWVKNNVNANKYYMKQVERILYLWKGRARTINDCSSKQVIRGGDRDSSEHNTQKPVWLMGYLIGNSSNPGDLVLDPFAGSGTAMVAAQHLGRRGVGIEIDYDHYLTMIKLVQHAVDYPDWVPNAMPYTTQSDLLEAAE